MKPTVDLSLNSSLAELNKLWDQERHTEAVDRIISKMLSLNPNSTDAQLRSGLQFDETGLLEGWNMRRCGLHKLPDEFCTLRVNGDLILYNNDLKTLPDCFGAISVTGELGLVANKLQHLPDSIGALSVGDLNLGYNLLRTLPASFEQISVENDLWLKGNDLTTIPALPNVKGRVTLREVGSPEMNERMD